MAKNKPRLYTYCLRYDTGLAPNPYWGICTLALCKPKIRRVAQEDDWIVGTGSKNSPIGNKSKYIVYAMKITQKLTMQEYDSFVQNECPNKIPIWHNNDYPRRVGDCIYDFSNGNPPKIRTGVHNEENGKDDLSSEYALISKHFYYFGNNPKKLDKSLYNIIKKGPGHKSKSNDPYVPEFICWLDTLNLKHNTLYGKPQIEIRQDSKCASNPIVCYQKVDRKCM